MFVACISLSPKFHNISTHIVVDLSLILEKGIINSLAGLPIGNKILEGIVQAFISDDEVGIMITLGFQWSLGCLLWDKLTYSSK